MLLSDTVCRLRMISNVLASWEDRAVSSFALRRWFDLTLRVSFSFSHWKRRLFILRSNSLFFQTRCFLFHKIIVPNPNYISVALLVSLLINDDEYSVLNFNFNRSSNTCYAYRRYELRVRNTLSIEIISDCNVRCIIIYTRAPFNIPPFRSINYKTTRSINWNGCLFEWTWNVHQKLPEKTRAEEHDRNATCNAAYRWLRGRIHYL